MDEGTSATTKSDQNETASHVSHDETHETKPRLRGFAAMTPDQRRALGSKGGRTAHARGTANKFTPETASVAGRKPHENGTAHKWTSEEAREAGRKGGSALRRRRNEEGSDDPPPSEGSKS
jgi:general stress protein YciG